MKIISGASSGGTVVVASAKSGITSVNDMEGKTFITPGIGCTHDVQFETFLQEQGHDKLTSIPDRRNVKTCNRKSCTISRNV